MVLFRLCCPFSFESVFSLIPVGEQAVSPDILYAEQPQITSGIAAVDRMVNAVLPAGIPDQSVNPLQLWVAAGVVLWVAVTIAMLLYSLSTAERLAHRLKKSAVQIQGNLYEAQGLPTAFVFGFPHPHIYLPAGLSDTEKNYIIKHEQTHIKRFDHLIKPLAFFVLSVHWFNPLVWVAFFISAKDMELSCDEQVVKELGGGIKRDYSASLLALSTGRRIVGGCPLAFGENDTKGRIKNVLNYKKPSFWVVVLAIIAVVALAAGLLSNPSKETVYALNSISYDPATGALRFTVSDKIPSKMAPYIQVSGRTEQDGMGMSLHLFEEESASGSWIPGKTYTANVPAGSLDFLKIYGTIASKDDAEKFVSAMTVNVDKYGNLDTQYTPERRNTGLGAQSAIAETTEVTSDEAQALVEKRYPPPLIIEADGDQTMLENQIGAVFRISTPTTSGDNSGETSRLVKIVGVLKSNSQLMEYNTTLGKWENMGDTPEVITPEPTFFVLPDMDAEQQKFNQDYVKPILLTRLLMKDWSADNYSALLPDQEDDTGDFLILAFEDFLGQEGMQPLWAQYEGVFPEKVVDEVLLARFPFTAAQLHEISSFYYRPEEKTYHYEGGRGGGPIECAVTNVTTQGNGIVVLEYVILTSYDADATTPEKEAYLNKITGTLTLKPATGGGYLYWSVAVGEHIDLE